ncbi:MCE family protein [Acetobacter persici]|uniref:Paraquat-inducible protein B n=1 Tax=Acetobacter persici TaxID=1076596 RepID=A0A1U9LF88_9PROT|nr:MlaD family protein [Acetobacter persici]AQT05114.1 paraquat-inducible protein B [Acetobacter persici]MBS1001446.1 MCE family protein [Acetobacter persici]MBS1015758.1 MCE family protein [Acetobacter persici]MCG0998136.1 MlaD family protein [Acetobacter persici]MCP9320819.1 MCE family protein [Acetobacter persici]
MAESTNRKTLIGAFVLGGGALALAVIMLFGHMRFFAPSREAVVVFQNSITGLAVGAPVNFRGVKVGSVKSITLRFDPLDRKAYIPVQLTLEPDQIHIVRDVPGGTKVSMQEMIANGLRAELNLQSFVTGQSNIELDFDKSTPAILHPRITGELEIPARLSTMEKLKDTLSDLPVKDIAGHADATLLSIKTLSDKMNTDLPPLLASVKVTTDRSHDTVQAATDAIRDLQAKLDVTLLKMDKLLQTSTDQLTNRGADMHATLASATKTLDTLQTILSPRSIDRANLDAALRDIAAAAASLRGFSSDVERNPQLLLMGRRP